MDILIKKILRERMELTCHVIIVFLQKNEDKKISTIHVSFASILFILVLVY